MPLTEYGRDAFAQTFAESVRTGYATLHEFTGALWRIWDRDRWHVPLQIGPKVPCVGDRFEFPAVTDDAPVLVYPVFWRGSRCRGRGSHPRGLAAGGRVSTDGTECTCPSARDGFRYDPPTDSYVHLGCGQPRAGGPTPESVLAFVDRVLTRRVEREGA